MAENIQELSNPPSLLEFNRAKQLRGLLQIEKELRNLYRLEAGYAGEQKVLHLFETEGSSEWTIIQNLWMEDDRSFECDFLVITNYGLYTFEIKNLTGHFTYENSSCAINGTKLDYDYIQQARKSYIKLRKILNRLSTNIPLKGAILFSGERNKVSIHSPVADIDVLQIVDLYEYIKMMKQDEYRYANHSSDISEIIQILESYKIMDSFQPEPLTQNDLIAARKGIYCSACKNYSVDITKQYIICTCGLHEPRDEAIVRTACEYGVLTFNKNFTIKEIREFTGGKSSHNYMKKVLDTHFKLTKNQRYSYYQNFKQPYEQIQDKFIFNTPKLHYTSRKNTEIKIFE